MRVGILDPAAGISGDMFLGALVDAGAPLAAMEQAARAVGGDRVALRAAETRRAGLRALKVDVLVDGEPVREGGGPDPAQGGEDAASRTPAPGKSWSELQAVVAQADLEETVRTRSLRVLGRIAEAEAARHGVPVESVHFHELGSLDALADVVATVAGVDSLRLESIYHGPVALGSGSVRTAHGALPVPAPATASLLEGRPCTAGPGPGELTTPTGAALLAELASPLPAGLVWTPRGAGYGAGSRDPSAFPNVLRLILADVEPSSSAREGRIAVIESAVDDATPEELGYAAERLFAAGALDVSLSPLVMKKGRPGVLLRVVARPGDAESLARRVLALTPSLGARWRLEHRLETPRREDRIEVDGIPVRIKVALLPDGAERPSPEYEDVRRLAEARELSLGEAARMAEREWERSR